MDRQEVFDTVVTEAFKQGKKSCGDGACLYRGDDNCKCFIGFLIKDEYYSKELEICSLFGEKIHDVLAASGYEYKLDYSVSSDNDLYFLSDLQSIHDQHDVEDWDIQFRRLADDYNLSVLVLDSR